MAIVCSNGLAHHPEDGSVQETFKPSLLNYFSKYLNNMSCQQSLKISVFYLSQCIACINVIFSFNMGCLVFDVGRLLTNAGEPIETLAYISVVICPQHNSIKSKRIVRFYHSVQKFFQVRHLHTHRGLTLKTPYMCCVAQLKLHILNSCTCHIANSVWQINLHTISEYSVKAVNLACQGPKDHIVIFLTLAPKHNPHHIGASVRQITLPDNLSRPQPDTV